MKFLCSYPGCKRVATYAPLRCRLHHRIDKLLDAKAKNDRSKRIMSRLKDAPWLK